MAIPASKLDFDHLEVVNVLEILADGGFCVAGAAFAKDHVASCALSDSVDVVAGEVLEAM